jgi:hypothetical protein
MAHLGSLPGGTMAPADRSVGAFALRVRYRTKFLRNDGSKPRVRQASVIVSLDATRRVAYHSQESSGPSPPIRWAPIDTTHYPICPSDSDPAVSIAGFFPASDLRGSVSFV